MFVKVKSKEIFNSWKHFALWWLPLSAFFIFIASPTGGDGFGLDGMIDREIVTWWFAGLFLLISLILITYKSIKLRGK
jgi:lipopolysaccharide export LptBFGC system permease protein LptF